MVEPRSVHWVAAKHVLRYLHGTIGYGLRYTAGDGVKLEGFTDSDWAGSAVDRKKTPRGAVLAWDQPWFLGSARNKLL